MGEVKALKTLLKKEKLLLASNFSFSQSVFYPSEELSAIFMKFENVVRKLFQFGRVKNLLERVMSRTSHWILVGF